MATGSGFPPPSSRALRSVVLGHLLLAIGGCSAEESLTSAENEAPSPAYCNPLSRAECLLPWPSTFYLAEDSSTQTGWRVRYESQALPATAQGQHLDPTRYNLADGFSVGTQILAVFTDGVASEGLPGPSNLSASLAPESPIWVLEYPSGVRVPFYAETDWNAQGGEAAALIIRPQQALSYGSRYVVALRTSLRSRDDVALAPPAGFLRLRDRLPTADPILEGQRKRLEEVFEFLGAKGLARDQLALAWDFYTASEQSATGDLRTLVAELPKRLPSTGPAYSLQLTEHSVLQDHQLWREGTGEIEVPSYLSGTKGDGPFVFDPGSGARYFANRRYPFRVHVPRCALSTNTPLPILVVGHGLTG